MAATENLDVVQSLLDKWQTDDAHAENSSLLPHLTTSLSTQQPSEPLTTEPVADYGASCFLVPGLLALEECQRLIDDCEALGLVPVETARADYRGCARLMAAGPGLADVLWRRVAPVLDEVEVPEDPHAAFVHGPPHLTRGRWRPVGLNPILRVCRYEPGQHFAPHFDGHLVRDAACRSLQTLMLYLNEGFAGGATRFVHPRQGLHRDEEGRYCAEETNILCSVKPRTGMAIVFNHHRLHEGERLGDGRKYILRTDIMFERADGRVPTAVETQAMELLQQAERYEAHHEMDKAVSCYRRAFKLCPELEAAT